MKVGQLRKIARLVIHDQQNYKKDELIQEVLRRQRKHNPILIETEKGYTLNPQLEIYDYNGWEKLIGNL
jgi:hypothetical protein